MRFYSVILIWAYLAGSLVFGQETYRLFYENGSQVSNYNKLVKKIRPGDFIDFGNGEVIQVGELLNPNTGTTTLVFELDEKRVIRIPRALQIQEGPAYQDFLNSFINGADDVESLDVGVRCLEKRHDRYAIVERVYPKMTLRTFLQTIDRQPADFKERAKENLKVFAKKMSEYGELGDSHMDNFVWDEGRGWVMIDWTSEHIPYEPSDAFLHPYHSLFRKNPDTVWMIDASDQAEAESRALLGEITDLVRRERVAKAHLPVIDPAAEKWPDLSRELPPFVAWSAEDGRIRILEKPRRAAGRVLFSELGGRHVTLIEGPSPGLHVEHVGFPHFSLRDFLERPQDLQMSKSRLKKIRKDFKAFAAELSEIAEVPGLTLDDIVYGEEGWKLVAGGLTRRRWAHLEDGTVFDSLELPADMKKNAQEEARRMRRGRSGLGADTAGSRSLLQCILAGVKGLVGAR